MMRATIRQLVVVVVVVPVANCDNGGDASLKA